MIEQKLLEQICDLVLTSDIYPEQMPLEWMSRLIQMHHHRWLYCSMKGEELVAVGGAYRIQSWDDSYLYQLPESENGDILFIPFVAAKREFKTALLRLLRFCLKDNPGIREIIYFKKQTPHNAQEIIRRPVPSYRRHRLVIEEPVTV